MKSILRSRYVPVSLFALSLGGGLVAYGCTTTAVNGSDAGSPGSSSSSSGGGGSGSSSGSSSSGSGSSSSGSGGSSSDGGLFDSGTATCFPPPAADGGATIITAGATAFALDAGGPYGGTFGNYKGYGGGTFYFPTAPGTDSPANPDAGVYCSTLASQSTFVTNFTPATNAFVLTGTVALYSGFGMWQYFCDNASAYRGIQFTASGDVGIPGEDAGDAGTATQMQIQVTELANTPPLNADNSVNPGGTCPGDCAPAVAYFNVTSTPTPITILWSQFSGGSPNPTIDNPGQIHQIQFQLPWPCTGGVPYMTNVTISNLAFVP
jgi:hypothetical protein